jgi:hypothetical protein
MTPSKKKEEIGAANANESDGTRKKPKQRARVNANTRPVATKTSLSNVRACKSDATMLFAFLKPAIAYTKRTTVTNKPNDISATYITDDLKSARSLVCDRTVWFHPTAQQTAAPNPTTPTKNKPKTTFKTKGDALQVSRLKCKGEKTKTK